MPRKKNEEVVAPQVVETLSKTRTRKKAIIVPVDKVVDYVDNVDKSKTRSKKTLEKVEQPVDDLCAPSSVTPISRLTILTDKVDVRYGMLLKYFPKDGELRIPNGTCDTGYYVAANKHITQIHFPKSMETIGHGSFFHCEDLTI